VRATAQVVFCPSGPREVPQHVVLGPFRRVDLLKPVVTRTFRTAVASTTRRVRPVAARGAVSACRALARRTLVHAFAWRVLTLRSVGSPLCTTCFVRSGLGGTPWTP
jgi:hypothetical protein